MDHTHLYSIPTFHGKRRTIAHTFFKPPIGNSRGRTVKFLDDAPVSLFAKLHGLSYTKNLLFEVRDFFFEKC